MSVVISDRLTRSFYARPTLEVAPDLLGKLLVYNSPEGPLVGEINEVEAYLGQEDPASHAFRGSTARTEVMFGEAGHVYVYQIYGLHYCMNIVCETAGVAGAVLIRSLIPRQGLQLMAHNRNLPAFSKATRATKTAQDMRDLTNGPAKLCKALGITRQQNGLDLVTSPLIYLTENTRVIPPFKISPRIGISKATDKLWRFYYQS